MDKLIAAKRKNVSTSEIKTLITSLAIAATLGFWSWFSNHARIISTSTAENLALASSGQSVGVMSNPPLDPPILGAGQLPLRQVTLPTQGTTNQNLPFINNLPLVNNSLPLANGLPQGGARVNNGGRRNTSRPDPVARTGSSRR